MLRRLIQLPDPTTDWLLVDALRPGVLRRAWWWWRPLTDDRVSADDWERLVNYATMLIASGATMSRRDFAGLSVLSLKAWTRAKKLQDLQRKEARELLRMAVENNPAVAGELWATCQDELLAEVMEV